MQLLAGRLPSRLAGARLMGECLANDGPVCKHLKRTQCGTEMVCDECGDSIPYDL
jgi:hypothetical protein